MTDVVGGEEVPVIDTTDITDLINLLGPKRVRTKDMEIEAHSPEAMQRLAERRASKGISMSNFRKDIAVPKDSFRCTKRDLLT